MIDLIGMTTALLTADDVKREQIINALYYAARGIQHGLMLVLDNTPPDSPLYRQAWDALDTLSKFGNEQTVRYAPPVSEGGE